MSLNITEFALSQCIIKLQVKSRLHDTTCYQTGCQTGLIDNRLNVCIHDTTGCQTGCTTRFDNRLNKQWLFLQQGCQTGCCTTDLTTGSMFVYMIQMLVKPVVEPVDNWLHRVNGVLQLHYETNKDVKVSRTDAKILALVSVSASKVRFHLASRQS